MQADNPTFSSVWGTAVDELMGRKGLLSPDNGAVDQLFQRKPALSDLAKQFVAALKDDTVPAATAKDILHRIRALFHVGGNAPETASKFPTLTYNCLVEYVSAKRLYEAGMPWPLPGLDIDRSGVKKADYGVAGVGEDVEVGDHLVCRSGKTEGDLVELLSGDVSSKLATYRTGAGRRVRVVVDVSESPAYATIADHGRAAWLARTVLAVKPLAAQSLTDPLTLVVIVTAADAHAFNRDDLGL